MGETILRSLTAGLNKRRYVNVMNLAYILAPRSGKAKSAEVGKRRRRNAAGELKKLSPSV